MSTFKVNIPAGPIWDQTDAPAKAHAVAAAHQSKWTGEWHTVVPSEMSVVEVELNVKNSGPHEYKTNVLAGPLWSNDEAQKNWCSNRRIIWCNLYGPMDNHC